MTTEKRQIGIREIAEAAGVSITTVSHALNGKGRVQPDTRERIRAIAQRLQYRPNATARHLVEGRTGLLGLAISQRVDDRPHLSDFAYFTQLMSAATTTALELGYALVLTPPSRRLGGGSGVAVDGAIIIDPIQGDPLAGDLRAAGVPVVTTARVPEDDPDTGYWVDNDHYRGSRLLLEHLHRRGARSVALLLGQTVMTYSIDMERAVRGWCEQAGVTCRVIKVRDLSERDGYEATAGLLAEADPPDAVYATYDRLAHGALFAAEAHHVRVPEDLLVVSTATASAIPVSVRPALTMLDLHPDQIGQRAVEMLVELVQGREPARPRVYVPTRITARASTRRPVVRGPGQTRSRRLAAPPSGKA